MSRYALADLNVVAVSLNSLEEAQYFQLGGRLMGFSMSMDRLKRLWEKWKRIAHKIGDFQARLILGVFYFVLLAPFALVLKLFSDPLHLKIRNAKWFPYPGTPHEDPLARARSQF